MNNPEALPGNRGFDGAEARMEHQRSTCTGWPWNSRRWCPSWFRLDRASASILLNIAEAGRFARAEKAHFYLIARGSTTESAAVLDILRSRGLIAAPVHRHATGLLIRVTRMLTRLVKRMQA